MCRIPSPSSRPASRLRDRLPKGEGWRYEVSSTATACRCTKRGTPSVMVDATGCQSLNVHDCTHDLDSHHCAPTRYLVPRNLVLCMVPTQTSGKLGSGACFYSRQSLEN